MSLSCRTLGVIPARGGSKRVPRKNIRTVCGVPLIGYTIRAAQASNLTDWVVSTEDPEIESVAHSYGAHVLKRPCHLSGDNTTSGAVMLHALEAMEANAQAYDMVVLLHPTSPIRDPKHIDEAVEMLASSNKNYLASVQRLPEKTHRNVTLGGNLWSHGGWMLNASIYAVKANELRKEGKHTSTASVLFEMDRFHSLDVDEEIDLEIAEVYIRCLGH